MNELVKFTVESGVAVITIDNPPVNALSTSVAEGIAAAIERAARDASISAVVLIGAGRTFVAGADIKNWKTRRRAVDRALPTFINC